MYLRENRDEPLQMELIPEEVKQLCLYLQSNLSARNLKLQEELMELPIISITNSYKDTLQLGDKTVWNSFSYPEVTKEFI
jgi:hypothetical protein